MMSKILLIVVCCVLVGPLTPEARAAPADIHFPPRETVKEIPPAVFPHWFHRIRFRCSVCHTAIFPMEVTGPEITMEAMREGKFCGACHNSETAWAVTFDRCVWCHTQD